MVNESRYRVAFERQPPAHRHRIRSRQQRKRELLGHGDRRERRRRSLCHVGALHLRERLGRTDAERVDGNVGRHDADELCVCLEPLRLFGRELRLDLGCDVRVLLRRVGRRRIDAARERHRDEQRCIGDRELCADRSRRGRPSGAVEHSAADDLRLGAGRSNAERFDRQLERHGADELLVQLEPLQLDGLELQPDLRRDVGEPHARVR